MAPADAGAVGVSPSGAGTVGAAVADAVERLAGSGSPTPRLDAEVLVAHVLGRDRTWVIAHPDAPCPAASADDLARAIDRRASGEPVAYIRGFKDWLSLRIRTDARALIPRPETELLAQAAVDAVTSRLASGPLERAVVAWDVGTGSGCLAVALARRFATAIALGRVRVIASDSSPAALGLAWENATAHGVADLIELVPSDLLTGAGGALPAPDVVVANLPYVPSDAVDRLPIAASFEPRPALDGGPDGLAVIRELIAQLPLALAPGGVALLEIGAGQASPVRDAAERAGLRLRATIADLAGVERVVGIEHP